MKVNLESDWRRALEEQRARTAATMKRLFKDDREKRECLRKILESWDLGTLQEIISDYYSDRSRSKHDAVDEIMSEHMLDDEIDETIQQELDEKRESVKDLLHLTEREPDLVAFQDCDHINPETEKPDFDLMERCRFCYRAKGECVDGK